MNATFPTKEVRIKPGVVHGPSSSNTSKPAKLELGDCGRPYGTPCSHEHACIRCPVLRVDPRQRDRLAAIIRNLTDRITESTMNGRPGEAQGLQTSLQAAQTKLAGLHKPAPNTGPVALGMPVIRGE